MIKVTTKTVETIETTNILTQSAYWATIKEKQGFETRGFEVRVPAVLLDPGSTHDQEYEEDLIVLVDQVSENHSYAYVPYGPKLEPQDEAQGKFLELLSEELREHLPVNCSHIQYDLSWKNQWANDQDYVNANGELIEHPSVRSQEFRINFNTENWKLRKSNQDALPKSTFFLDLTLSEKDLLYNMRYNTRYNIRRASKQGIQISEYGLERLDDWYELFAETAARNDLNILEKEYFQYVLEDHRADGVETRLLMAEQEGELLAAMILVMSDQRGTYLYGASSRSLKQIMASYALQWEAIKRSKRAGCVEYDFFGCAPGLFKSHPLYGVHLFKKGFGGDLYHRMGCWDYPLSEKLYEEVKIGKLVAV